MFLNFLAALKMVEVSLERGMDDMVWQHSKSSLLGGLYEDYVYVYAQYNVILLETESNFTHDSHPHWHVDLIGYYWLQV